MGVYALPLAAEVVRVGVLFVFSGMQVLVQYDSTTTEATRKFIDGVLIAVGVLYLTYFAIRVVTDMDGFFTRKNAAPADSRLVGSALGPRLTRG